MKKTISKIKNNNGVIYSVISNKDIVYKYTIFKNLSVLIKFNMERKSLKVEVKASTFSKQLMYIIFN